MTARIGINGFGRIGRDVVRAVLDDPGIEIVAGDDIADPASLAQLLRRDSTFGPLRRDVAAIDGHLVVGDRKIAVTSVRDPSELPWRELGVDVAIESTGRFRTREQAAGHLAAGARKVVISAPGKGVDATIVLGVNDETYDPARHDVISNASCT